MAAAVVSIRKALTALPLSVARSVGVGGGSFPSRDSTIADHADEAHPHLM